MRTRTALALRVLQTSQQMLKENISGLTLDEALEAAGGYRSVLGILKHTASWSHVYHSYAFEQEPTHLNTLAWPRGLRDTIEQTQEYVDEIVAWLEQSFALWEKSVGSAREEDFDEERLLHWGEKAPLFDIVVLNAAHWTYHTGELNEVLSILRGEAWVYTEEVEENHISTVGHRIRPAWMTEEHARAYEEHLARRDEALHGGT
ncbi:MAG: DinB family protein [Chloroflexi bacterium]|nr:DinB family protein [Chloroflexota bacterium]